MSCIVQNALHCLEGMKQESGRQSLIDRLHRDRGRQLHEITQPRQLDKRVSFIPVLSLMPDNASFVIWIVFSWVFVNSENVLRLVGIHRIN